MEIREQLGILPRTSPQGRHLHVVAVVQGRIFPFRYLKNFADPSREGQSDRIPAIKRRRVPIQLRQSQDVFSSFSERNGTPILQDFQRLGYSETGIASK